MIPHFGGTEGILHVQVHQIEGHAVGGRVSSADRKGIFVTRCAEYTEEKGEEKYLHRFRFKFLNRGQVCLLPCPLLR